MFENFPQSDIEVVGKSGEVKAKTRAIIDSKLATIPDASVHIEPGDEIRRRIPSGIEEAFEVIDPVYFPDNGGMIPAHLQVKIQRKGTFQPGTGGNFNFFVSGNNARVNFQSTDNSQNSINEASVFAELASTIREQIAEASARDELLQLVAEMHENSQDKPKYLSLYQKFISIAADHLGVLGPFLPAITGLLTNGS